MIINEYLSSGLHGYSAVERLPSHVPCASGVLLSLMSQPHLNMLPGT
jgi:hypothetical protein